MISLAAGAYKVRLARRGGKPTRLRPPLPLALPGVLLVLWTCERPHLPREYRDLTVPAGVLVSDEARARGRALFLEHCAICHGERADGEGPRRNLSVPAADLSDRAWRARVTPRRVFFVIREGVRGSPMPAWKILDSQQTWDLVAYVLSVAEKGPVSGLP